MQNFLYKKPPKKLKYKSGCKNGLLTNIFPYIHFSHHNTFSTKFKSEMNLALQVGTLILLKLQQQLNLLLFYFNTHSCFEISAI